MTSFIRLLTLLTILFSLIFFSKNSFSVEPFSGETFDRTHGCEVIKGEYLNTQHIEIDVPKNRPKSICLKISGHTDGVGLLLNRYAVTENDRMKVNVIPKPYVGIGKDKIYQLKNIPTKEVSKLVIGLLEEMQWSLDSEIAVQIEVVTANHDRKMVIFCDMTDSGANIVSIGLTTEDFPSPASMN